jgi:hypothetical protein
MTSTRDINDTASNEDREEENENNEPPSPSPEEEGAHSSEGEESPPAEEGYLERSDENNEVGEAEGEKQEPPSPEGEAAPQAEDDLERSRGKRRRLVLFIVLFSALLLTGLIFLIFLIKENPSGGSSAKDFDDLPYSFVQHLWDTNGTKNGLRLEILNSLDDSWQVEFQKAVYDWDNGDPDALTLTTKRVVDSSCQSVPGVIKVCNADYGKTGWRALGEQTIDNMAGFILTSVVKLNEYYLSNDTEAMRQYVMCGQIGRGIGLPSTDEDFLNTDLGNCLDTTITPENNTKPDYSNYARLEALYGVVNKSRSLLLRSVGSDNDNAQAHPSLNPRLLSAYQEAMVNLQQDMFTTNHGEQSESSAGWRLLESYRGGRKFGRDLGEGLMLNVNFLHPL